MVVWCSSDGGTLVDLQVDVCGEVPLRGGAEGMPATNCRCVEGLRAETLLRTYFQKDQPLHTTLGARTSGEEGRGGVWARTGDSTRDAFRLGLCLARLPCRPCAPESPGRGEGGVAGRVRGVGR